MAILANRIKLKQIILSGFKSFDSSEHTIKFGDVTVLIGANGAGKSNIVSFFKMIGFITDNTLETYIADEGFATSILHYGPKVTQKITARLVFQYEKEYRDYHFVLRHAPPDNLIFETEGVAFGNEIEQSANTLLTLLSETKKSWVASEANEKIYDRRVKSVYNLLKNCSLYQFHDTSSTARIRNSGYINDADFLRSDAGNLAAFLYSMQQNEEAKKYYDRIVNHIANAMPQFGDFVLRPSARNKDYILLDWKEKGNDYLFGPHQLSDGSLRYIALATLLLQSPEKMPSVIILDEPELGLHPSAINDLAGMIRSASRHCQIIIATQSPGLLDEFELNEVVVIERENKTSVIRNFNEQELKNWLKDYSLSELWEKNVIGGQP